MAHKISMAKFRAYSVSDLNKINGGVEDTTYKQSNGYSYKDYKYGKDEINETDSNDCACNKWGGTDKTNTLA